MNIMIFEENIREVSNTKGMTEDDPYENKF